MAPKTTKRVRRPKTELQGKFEGLIMIANEQRVIHLLAGKLNVDATAAKKHLSAIVSRVGRKDGIVSRRSEADITRVFEIVLSLKPNLTEYVAEVKGAITYQSSKTGPRNNSWIRDLMAGIPRKENGVWYQYCQITEEEAREACAQRGIDLPTDEAELDTDEADVEEDEDDE